jgi:hypothetical protein
MSRKRHQDTQNPTEKGFEEGDSTRQDPIAVPLRREVEFCVLNMRPGAKKEDGCCHPPDRNWATIFGMLNVFMYDRDGESAYMHSNRGRTSPRENLLQDRHLSINAFGYKLSSREAHQKR